MLFRSHRPASGYRTAPCRPRLSGKRGAGCPCPSDRRPTASRRTSNKRRLKVFSFRFGLSLGLSVIIHIRPCRRLLPGTFTELRRHYRPEIEKRPPGRSYKLSDHLSILQAGAAKRPEKSPCRSPLKALPASYPGRPAHRNGSNRTWKIGRASCRERV